MDSLISNVASTALNSLASKALREVAAAWQLKSDLDDLTKTIRIIRDVLVAYEGHHQRRDLDALIDRLKDAVYDADDLIDEFTTLVERKKLMMTGRGRFTKEFRLFFSCENQVGTAFKISREITKIRKNLNKIVEDRDRFASMLPSNEPSSADIERDTFSFVHAEEVIGRDDDKQMILDVLLRHEHHDDQGSHAAVLGIYGIGGLGKTTIAQLVFNDKVVQEHFEMKLWVCIGDFVGNKFNKKLIIRKIIMSATDSSCSDDLGLEQLHRKLREKMRGKKYFLVLDDLWEENYIKLLQLRELLVFGEKGSKVLVTTRSKNTARNIGTIPPMKLQFLSNDASWTLFEKMTGMDRRKDQRLVQIGKEIVKKCANLPLAIKVIGSLLRGKNETEWQHFKDRDLANIDATHDIMPLLKLSYYRLHPQLKHCFIYCSLFPKDSILVKTKLCYLWIAQGFITSSSPSNERILEDEAEQYFTELLHRCFFQDICIDIYGEIWSVKMHDLIHDLAKEVAGKDVLITDDSGDQNHWPRGVRHLCFSKFSSMQNLICSMQGQNHLRTFLGPISRCQQRQVNDVINRPPYQQWEVSDVINSFKCVRVLDLRDSGIKQLPESISELIHLRYLNLYANDFEVLPKSITRLHNLETLNLDFCSKLKELPWDLSKLVNLQYLGIICCEELACMPARMGGLTRLQRLNRFVVGEAKLSSTDHAYTRCCNSKPHIINASGLDDLIPLMNLRGTLEIYFSKKEISDSMAIRTNVTAGCLLNKSKLTCLTIDLNSFEADDASRDEGLLEFLQPHCHLKSFNLIQYGGMKFPNWMLMDNLATAFSNLVRIVLLDCTGCLNLPILSRLPYLKSAWLQNLPLLEYIESQSYKASASKSVEFFPSLQGLILNGLSNVKGWWMPTSDETDLKCDQHMAHPSLPPFFPCLTRLMIKNCPNMKSMPFCPHLEELALGNLNENFHIITEIKEYSILAASLGPSATSTSVSSSSSSTPNYFPSTHLLRRLEIDNIGYLNHLPKQHLQSLTKLCMSGCKDVALSVAHDEEEDKMAYKSLQQLPKGLEYLTNLKTLGFKFCDTLVELPGWISRLSSLESLEIDRCKKLKSLPDGIRDLTSLRKFKLEGCSKDLQERCKEPTGEDRHKIKHVSEIIIGYADD